MAATDNGIDENNSYLDHEYDPKITSEEEKNKKDVVRKKQKKVRLFSTLAFRSTLVKNFDNSSIKSSFYFHTPSKTSILLPHYQQIFNFGLIFRQRCQNI